MAAAAAGGLVAMGGTKNGCTGAFWFATFLWTAGICLVIEFLSHAVLTERLAIDLSLEGNVQITAFLDFFVNGFFTPFHW